MSDTTDTLAADLWAAKIEKLNKRKLPERPFTFHDEEASEAADRALTVCGSAELDARHRAERQHSNLKGSEFDDAVQTAIDKDKRVIAARKALTIAEKARDEANVTLTLRSLGSDAYEKMVAAHPATEEQEKDDMIYDVDTFAPAIISACCTDPMTVEQAASLIKTLNQGEAAMLFQTAVSVNQSARVSLGKG